MHYVAHIHSEDGQLLAEFPDAPGCQTFAGTHDQLREMAQEALEGWLEAHLVDGQSPPRPRAHSTAPAGYELWRVHVRPGLSSAVQLRWARQDAKLSQSELARKAGVSQQQIAKLEHPDENPTLGTLAKVAAALGVTVSVALEPMPARSAVKPAKRAAKRRKAA